MTEGKGKRTGKPRARAGARAGKGESAARARRAASRDDAERVRIGVVDTTFARINMGDVALATNADEAPDAELGRVTVPGVKDLPAACRMMLDAGCDAVLACGWIGPETIDKTCGHEASLGLMQLRVMFGRPLLEVFVHEDEAPLRRSRKGPDHDVKTLAYVARERTREHALNACWMLLDPERLIRMAGTGQRQGFEDAGPLED